MDLSAPGGLAKADAARAVLRDKIKAAKEPFTDPVGLANQLHKRLTGLRTDFTSFGEKVDEDITKAILAESKRVARLAEEQRRKDQEAADAEARQQAEALAKAAAKRKASPETVALLKEQARTTVAPPVAVRPVPGSSLSASSVVEKWKGQLVGTAEDGDVNPEMLVLSPAQQQSAREFFAAVGAGTVSLDLACINWPEINRKAHAERRTLLIPGIEAVDVGGLRKKR